MSKQEILSTLLFASQDDAEDVSEDDMMKMVGGSMAQSVFANPAGAVVKSAFSSVGINIDSLPFVGRSRDANKTKKEVQFSESEIKIIIEYSSVIQNSINTITKSIELTESLFNSTHKNPTVVHTTSNYKILFKI